MKSKLTLLILLACISAVLINCRKTDFAIQNLASDEKISAAQSWFSSYQKRTVFNNYFKNALFLWDQATLFKFSNGNEAVAVPVFEKHQNLAYRGKRVMYLYPWKNKKGYYPVVYELIPSMQSVLKNKGALNLKHFEGILNSWTLKEGFRNGTLYKNGLPEKRVEIKGISPQQLALQPVTVTYILPSPSGVYNVYYMIGNISNTLSWSGYGENPCEYGGCDLTDLSSYFNENWFRSMYEKLINQLFEDEIVDSTNKPCITSTLNTLKDVSDFLPDMLRVFFGTDPTVTLTFKVQTNSTWTTDGQGNPVPPEGAHTPANLNTSNFNIIINDYYSDITDLGMAATIIHETIHAQFLEHFQQAVLHNDTSAQRALAEGYGGIFSGPEGVTNFAIMVNGGSAAQHAYMFDTYRGQMAGGLYAFALARGLSVTYDDCYDLAVTGTFDSKSFQNLSLNEQQRLTEKVLAEKDPKSNLYDPNGNAINSANKSALGKTCPK